MRRRSKLLLAGSLLTVLLLVAVYASRLLFSDITTTTFTAGDRYSVRYPKDWKFEPKGVSDELDFEESCETFTDPSGNYRIEICGPYMWPFDDVVRGDPEHGPLQNIRKTDFEAGGHRAAMLEGTVNSYPETHIFVEKVKLEKFHIDGEIEGETEATLPTGDVYGTLDVVIIPLKETYSIDGYEQAKKTAVEMIRSMEISE